MPCIQYEQKRFKGKAAALIDKCNSIIVEYQAQGYVLTVRQLYYQLVSRDIIPNKLREYKRLIETCANARLAGLMDWDAIVDEGRNLRSNPHWDDPATFLDSVADQFAIDKWEDQECRLEVWIEKDALRGVIAGLCQREDVPYFSCRGYSSLSEMHVAALRHRYWKRKGHKMIVLHLGDHDPSGIDMTRDIDSRLATFLADTQIVRVALNKDQIEQYDPPPNPAKVTDSRYASYWYSHGQECWELDALSPAVINGLILDEIKKYRNEKRWRAKVKEEKEGRARLRKIVDSLEE